MAPVYSNGFDAHTHLEALADAEACQRAMKRAHAAGVRGVAVLGGDPREWDAVVRTANRAGAVYGLGVHPWWVSGTTDASDVVDRLSAADPPVVGEIGLDRLRGHIAAQLPVFEAQLWWAAKTGRPVVLHAVRTVDEVLAAVANCPGVHAMIHGFTGSPQQVQRAVDLGVYLSVGPLALRAQGRMVKAIQAIPDALLVLETDTPAHPAPCDEPAGLVSVAQAVATLRGVDAAALLAQTGDTARRFYGLLPEDES